MDWELLLGLGRFVLATTLILLLTVPTAFVIIQDAQLTDASGQFKPLTGAAAAPARVRLATEYRHPPGVIMAPTGRVRSAP